MCVCVDVTKTGVVMVTTSLERKSRRDLARPAFPVPIGKKRFSRAPLLQPKLKLGRCGFGGFWGHVEQFGTLEVIH